MGQTTAMQSYTPDERSLAKAATQRYGASVARRLIEEIWDRAPTRESLINWRDDARVPVAPEHEQYWQEHDTRIAQQVRARVLPTFNKVMGAIDDVLDSRDDDDDSDDGPPDKAYYNRLRLVQGLTISAGILHDKLVPGSGRYGAPAISAGDGATINLYVTPPAAEPPPSRIIEVE